VYRIEAVLVGSSLVLGVVTTLVGCAPYQGRWQKGIDDQIQEREYQFLARVDGGGYELYKKDITRELTGDSRWSERSRGDFVEVVEEDNTWRGVVENVETYNFEEEKWVESEMEEGAALVFLHEELHRPQLSIGWLDIELNEPGGWWCERMNQDDEADKNWAD